MMNTTTNTLNPCKVSVAAQEAASKAWAAWAAIGDECEAAVERGAHAEAGALMEKASAAYVHYELLTAKAAEAAEAAEIYSKQYAELA